MEFGETKCEPYLSIVVPVYGSEECLHALVSAIDEEMGPTGLSYETILINDYSLDRSWQVIEAICECNPNVIGADLRRNFGQDNAILTGMGLARGRYIAIMDDDLQTSGAGSTEKWQNGSSTSQRTSTCRLIRSFAGKSRASYANITARILI